MREVVVRNNRTTFDRGPSLNGRPFVMGGNMATNPRYSNGNMRRKNRARIKAMGLPCHICGKPIHYDEPSDHKHPWSFVIDEVFPVSRWKEGGYDSARACAEDFNNLKAAHYLCNQIKSNKVGFDINKVIRKINVVDGDW